MSKLEREKKHYLRGSQDLSDYVNAKYTKFSKLKKKGNQQQESPTKVLTHYIIKPIAVKKQSEPVEKNEKSKQEKINLEFLNCVKLNQIEKCLDLISPDRELKADLNSHFENDWTPLHFSCWKKYFKIVNLLIFNGADVNLLARNNLSPLMVACSSGSERIAKVLINAGAEPSGKDGGGNTPIHYAAKSGSIALMKTLLAISSVNLKTKNNIGMTPIDLAPNKESKKFLVKSQHSKEKRERETLIRIHKYRSENFAMLRGERKLEISRMDSSSTSKSDCNSSSTTSETEKLGPHHFMVHSLIGRGAFGEVYLVERKDTG